MSASDNPEPRAAVFSSDEERRVSEMLLAHGLAIDQVERCLIVRTASFCSTSGSFLSHFLDQKLHGIDHESGRLLLARCQSFSPAQNLLARKLSNSCAHVSNTAKLGSSMAQARSLFASDFPNFCAAALDARLLYTDQRLAIPLSSPRKPGYDEMACQRALAKAALPGAPILLATCVSRCCHDPRPESLAALLSLGFPAGGAGLTGHAPLYFASRRHASFGHSDSERPIECVKLLLAYGADPNELCHAHSGRDPTTALSAAIDSRHWPCCHLLLDHGADPWLSTFDGAPIEALLAEPSTRARALALQDRSALSALDASDPGGVPRRALSI